MARHDSGPSQEASSKSSHKFPDVGSNCGSQEEVTSTKATKTNMVIVQDTPSNTPAQETPSATVLIQDTTTVNIQAPTPMEGTTQYPLFSDIPLTNVDPEVQLEQLHDKITVDNGILKIVNVEAGESSKPKETTTKNTKTVTWSSMVQQNIPNPQPQTNDEITVTFNVDGSTRIQAPRSFLLEARKQWDSSIIGHFIGTTFSFKFIREQAFKIWKNLGLVNVYFSAKGYYTFRFKTIEQKNVDLNMNSVQMGGGGLFIWPLGWRAPNLKEMSLIECLVGLNWWMCHNHSGLPKVSPLFPNLWVVF